MNQTSMKKNSTPKKGTGLKYSLALAAAAALALTSPLAASAHVSIDPASAEPRSYTVVTVKVPNESSTAKTNRVELTIPVDIPFSGVRYVPVTGWTTQLVSEKLPEPVTVGDREITDAFTSVIWTAEPGSEIGDGQLQMFSLSLGPVPDTGSIALAAQQSYTDGEIVQWSDSGEDAEHPAPVLYVNDAPTDAHRDHETTDIPNENDSAAAAAPVDTIARVLGIGGLMVGTVGIVFALLTRRKQPN